MKTIVSNNKRSVILDQDLTFLGLKNFLEAEFPRSKDAELKFKDLNGQDVPITSQEDVELLKKIYNGQNFAQVIVDAKFGKKDHHRGCHKGHHNEHETKHGHGRRHRKRSGSSSEEKPRMNRGEKRAMMLSKIYGGNPSDYQTFVQQNDSLHMGKLIKAFAQINNVTKKPEWKNKSERLTKILAKNFGGEPSDYKDFQKNNEDLKGRELLQKYSQQMGVEFKPKAKRCISQESLEEKREGRAQKKIERLSVALGETPEAYEEATNLIKQNSSLNVKQILEKLQGEGRKVNFEKFFELRRRQNKERVGSMKKVKLFEKKETSPEKVKKSPRKEEKSKKLAGSEEPKPTPMKDAQSEDSIREKGRILIEMKEIFGPKRAAEYFKFINDNFSEGEANIIEKWIKTRQI